MPEPLTLVIFGASGDLTARKLIPSLYRMAAKDRLPPESRIVGVARSPMTDDEFRKRLAAAVREFAPKDWQQAAWDKFAPRLFYAPGDAAKPGGLDRLQAWLHEAEGSGGGRRLYYLAGVAPLYARIAKPPREGGQAGGGPGGRRAGVGK